MLQLVEEAVHEVENERRGAQPIVRVRTEAADPADDDDDDSDDGDAEEDGEVASEVDMQDAY